LIKYKINPVYESTHKDFLLNIKEYFNNNNKTIHKARNEIKVIEYNKNKFVVKSFKKPSYLKSIYYSKNDSKAKRSYEYGLKLKDLTPIPLGYIEFYENNKLLDSYHVSEYFDYDFTVATPMRDEKFPFIEKRIILKEFANFSFNLHNIEVLHLDYSAGNILIKKQNESNYIFKVVDLNRMKFKTLSLNERLKSFNMLWASDENMKIIASQYAKLLNLDENMVVKKAIGYAFRLKLSKNFKKLLKGKIKNIDW